MKSLACSITFLLCAAISPCCCCWPAPVPDPEPPPAPEPAPERRTNWCPGACSNMLRLHCQGWEGSAGRDELPGTADDVPCAKVCEDFEKAAIVAGSTDLSLHPACVAAAYSCTEAAACFGQ